MKGMQGVSWLSPFIPPESQSRHGARKHQTESFPSASLPWKQPHRHPRSVSLGYLGDFRRIQAGKEEWPSPEVKRPERTPGAKFICLGS